MTETEQKSVSLDELVGEHVLDAVDTSVERVKTYGENYEDANVIRFRLDGAVYTAIEDPSDGYRSAMDRIFVSDDPISNVFTATPVVGRKRADSEGRKNDVLELVDATTGKVVLAVGTDDIDDYYPGFVAQWSPENLAANQ